MNQSPIRVTVWGENHHEQHTEVVQHLYPTGMHTVIAEAVAEFGGPGMQVRTVTMDDPDQGLPAEVIDQTDVLIWWGHRRHAEVDEALVERVHTALLSGMGLIVLHSGHLAKVFLRAIGTTGHLRWRNEGDRELIWTIDPAHPIAAGVPNPMVLDQHEMFGEPFDIPTPDELVFVSWFSGGEVFRSGVTYRRGRGKLFYFSPGDQYYPIYFDPQIRRVLGNAARWAAPSSPREMPQVVQQPRGKYRS